MAQTGDLVTLKGVRLLFRNFAGEEGQYNKKGDRNFAVVLAPEIADDLASKDWNVKILAPRVDDEEGEETPYLPVAVNYENRPPNINVVQTNGRPVRLPESQVEMLDWADISNADLVVRAYAWNVNGKSGTKAYLKSLYVTLNQDELEREYAELEGDEE